MLPVLGALQNRYRDEPVVVAGVHSNKFPAEADAERIQAAMRRLPEMQRDLRAVKKKLDL